MFLREYDLISRAEPNTYAFVVRSRVISWLGGSEGLDKADFEERIRGQQRATMIYREDRAVGTVMVGDGDETYEVVGIVPVARNPRQSLITLQPRADLPERQIGKLATIDGAAFTIGGSLIYFGAYLCNLI